MVGVRLIALAAVGLTLAGVPVQYAGATSTNLNLVSAVDSVPRLRLRFAIRDYIHETEPVCPVVAVPKHRAAKEKLARSYSEQMAQLKRTNLRFDAEVAEADGHQDILEQRSKVRCGPPDTSMTRLDVAQSQDRLDEASNNLLSITAAIGGIDVGRVKMPQPDVMAKLTVVATERARLRGAIESYAGPSRWVCPGPMIAEHEKQWADLDGAFMVLMERLAQTPLKDDVQIARSNADYVLADVRMRVMCALPDRPVTETDRTQSAERMVLAQIRLARIREYSDMALKGFQ